MKPRGRGGRGGRPETHGDSRKQSGEMKRSEYKPRHNDDNTVYVGNLSFKTTEMKLGRAFEKFGEIKNVKIIEDENERSRGFGYVEFESKEAAEKSL